MPSPRTLRDQSVIKVLLLGDSGVGKTSIISTYCGGDFVESHIPTIGMDFKRKEIKLDDKNIAIQAWDSAGEERLKSLTSNYYEKADVIVICFGLTNMLSFTNACHYVNNLQRYENLSIIMVGTKLDEQNRIKKSGTEQEKIQLVNMEVVNRFISTNNLLFYEVSAKEKINIDLLFLEAAKLKLNKINHSVQPEFKAPIQKIEEKHSCLSCFAALFRKKPIHLRVLKADSDLNQIDEMLGKTVAELSKLDNKVKGCWGGKEVIFNGETLRLPTGAANMIKAYKEYQKGKIPLVVLLGRWDIELQKAHKRGEGIFFKRQHETIRFYKDFSPELDKYLQPEQKKKFGPI